MIRDKNGDEMLARALCAADGKVWWTFTIPAKYRDLARAVLASKWFTRRLGEAWDEGYNQAVRDHKAREDGAPYCQWPTTPSPHHVALARRRNVDVP